jgi:hypothetical protein
MKNEPIKKEDIISPSAIKHLKDIDRLSKETKGNVEELQKKLVEFKI